MWALMSINIVLCIHTGGSDESRKIITIYFFSFYVMIFKDQIQILMQFFVLMFCFIADSAG